MLDHISLERIVINDLTRYTFFGTKDLVLLLLLQLIGNFAELYLVIYCFQALTKTFDEQIC